MIKIKLCGLSRIEDIEEANALQPDYIGFVFAPGSRRYVTPEQAAKLKGHLAPAIKAVGVFVDADPEQAAKLLQAGVIDAAQLHGHETEDYIKELRKKTEKPIIQAFRIDSAEDVEAANRSGADYVLLDSGPGGTGTVFDWNWIEAIRRPYFLAGGLDPDNVRAACERWHPDGVDVSSGIETEGQKDKIKMAAFVAAVRKETIR